MLRRVIVAGLLTCVLGLTFCFSQKTNAGWIDAATGQPVMTIPVNGGPPLNDAGAQNEHMLSNTLGFNRDSPHAVTNGKNLYWDKECQTWKDAATGKEVLTIPVNGGPPLNDAGAQNEHMLSNTLGFNRDSPHAVTNGKNLYWVPCPPPPPENATNALPLIPQTQGNILPGGVMLPGKDKGDGTPDKPGTDVKTTDTKPTDAKTPTAPVKDDKPSKATAEKENPKGTKHLNGTKTATAHKSVKQAKNKPKEEKTQVHIEFFSTGGGRMGGSGLGR